MFTNKAYVCPTLTVIGEHWLDPEVDSWVFTAPVCKPVFPKVDEKLHRTGAKLPEAIDAQLSLLKLNRAKS